MLILNTTNQQEKSAKLKHDRQTDEHQTKGDQTKIPLWELTNM